MVPARTDSVIPGRKPHPDARRDSSRDSEPIPGSEGGDERGAADQDRRRTPSCEPVERQKDDGEHEGGAEVLLQKEKTARQCDSDHDRRRVLQARHIQAAQDARQSAPWLFELAKELPSGGEVAREEEYKQDLNSFHRLGGYRADDKVYFGVAGARSGPESQKQPRRQQARQQRNIRQLSQGHMFIIGPAAQEQEPASKRRPEHEIRKQRALSQRVAQAYHQPQARAAEEMNQRQQDFVAAKREPAPEPMHCIKGHEENQSMQREGEAELPRRSRQERCPELL